MIRLASQFRISLDLSSGRRSNFVPRPGSGQGFRIYRRGFTLVELLVVVAIMALLLSVVIAIFSGARAKSRDVTREEHAKTLQSALALYANNVGAYPATAAAGVCLTGSDAVSTALISAGAISTIPLDPRHTCGTAAHYHYTAPASDTYTITYTLETDSIPGKSAGQQQASP